MDVKIRTYLAELLGTYLFVLAGAGAVCAAFLRSDGPTTLGDVVGIALAEGLVLAVAVTMCAPLSVAACNPAITLALWVTRRLELREALIVGGMQFLGALLAGLSVRLLFGPEVLRLAQMGVPHLGSKLAGPDGYDFGGLAAGVSLEALFAFIVTLAVYATLIDQRGPKMGGLLVGLAQTAVVLLGFFLTGGAGNPARWFGPAIWQLTLAEPGSARPLSEHPIYWIGPMLGALAGCVVYMALLQPPEKKD
jgi:glycerol uptake facilitator-like aquaporin